MGQEALAIFERSNSPFGSSAASGFSLAPNALLIGDIGAAKAYFLRGMQAAEEINYLLLLQRTYDGLGMVALMEKDPEQAQQFFLKSLRISQECGQTREMLASLLELANVHVALGNLDEALGLLAVVLNHPASDQNSLNTNRSESLRDAAEKLRAQIEFSAGSLPLSVSMGERSKTAPRRCCGASPELAHCLYLNGIITL